LCELKHKKRQLKCIEGYMLGASKFIQAIEHIFDCVGYV